MKCGNLFGVNLMGEDRDYRKREKRLRNIFKNIIIQFYYFMVILKEM